MFGPLQSSWRQTCVSDLKTKPPEITSAALAAAGARTLVIFETLRFRPPARSMTRKCFVSCVRLHRSIILRIILCPVGCWLLQQLPAYCCGSFAFRRRNTWWCRLGFAVHVCVPCIDLLFSLERRGAGRQGRCGASQ